MPSEFPERWSRFLPPDDVKSRLHAGQNTKNTKDSRDTKDARDAKDAKDLGISGRTTGDQEGR